MEQVLGFLQELGGNKMFVGLTMILMQLGSRHVLLDISAGQQNLMRKELVKKVVVFCMFFVPTRDIMTASMLTFAFFFITDNVLNEKKSYSIITGPVPQEEEYVNRDVVNAQSQTPPVSEYQAYVDAIALRQSTH